MSEFFIITKSLILISKVMFSKNIFLLFYFILYLKINGFSESDL